MYMYDQLKGNMLCSFFCYLLRTLHGMAKKVIVFGVYSNGI